MGRILYGDRGDPTRHLPTEGWQRQHSHKHMEHRTVMSFLPLKLGLIIFFHLTFTPTSTPARALSAWVARGLHEGAIPPLFFYYHIVILFTQTKGWSVPLFTLCNLCFKLLIDRTPPRPTVTSSWASWAMPGLLKLQPTKRMDMCEKERIKTNLC